MVQFLNKICLTNLYIGIFLFAALKKTAAIKYRIAVIIRAVVNADINGAAIALGKRFGVQESINQDQRIIFRR